jgi:hypothetical protein
MLISSSFWAFLIALAASYLSIKITSWTFNGLSLKKEHHSNSDGRCNPHRSANEFVKIGQKKKGSPGRRRALLFLSVIASYQAENIRVRNFFTGIADKSHKGT